MSYKYTENITDERLDFMAKEDKICKYLDIPLQHVSNKILKLMNRHLQKSDIEKLFNVLVAEKIQVLENDLETKLCFLARYSGRRIPHLELKPIEWKMLGPDRAKALGYLIKETAASDYATGVRFFYFDKDGEEIKPDRGEVATGAHQFAKPERQESTRTAFEKALNEFLAEYRGEE